MHLPHALNLFLESGAWALNQRVLVEPITCIVHHGRQLMIDLALARRVLLLLARGHIGLRVVQSPGHGPRLLRPLLILVHLKIHQIQCLAIAEDWRSVLLLEVGVVLQLDRRGLLQQRLVPVRLLLPLLHFEDLLVLADRHRVWRCDDGYVDLVDRLLDSFAH